MSCNLCDFLVGNWNSRVAKQYQNMTKKERPQPKRAHAAQGRHRTEEKNHNTKDTVMFHS